MSGIYQIYNPINNKRYIGSSINVERRLKEHLRNLEKNRHCNDHLQSAYNKYKDVLQFQFLEECEPDECLIFEQYYLDYYKSYIREFGYNIDPEAKYALRVLKLMGLVFTVLLLLKPKRKPERKQKRIMILNSPKY